MLKMGEKECCNENSLKYYFDFRGKKKKEWLVEVSKFVCWIKNKNKKI